MDIGYQLKYDGSENDLKWLIWYTRWPRQMAENALRQWGRQHNKPLNTELASGAIIEVAEADK